MEDLFQGENFSFLSFLITHFGRIDNGMNDNDDKIFTQGLRYTEFLSLKFRQIITLQTLGRNTGVANHVCLASGFAFIAEWKS